MNINKETFWSKIDIKDKSECWEWIDLKGTGKRGQYRIDGMPRRSYRVALALHLNVDERDLETVCHECDNPTCCNPHHLSNSDMQHNQSGMMDRGRGRGQFKAGFVKVGGEYIKALYKPKSEYDRPTTPHCCERCGKEYKARQDHKSSRFCSRQCSIKSNSESKRNDPEFIWIKNRKHKEVKCKLCGKIKIMRYDNPFAKNGFCSKRCMEDICH